MTAYKMGQNAYAHAKSSPFEHGSKNDLRFWAGYWSRCRRYEIGGIKGYKYAGATQ